MGRAAGRPPQAGHRVIDTDMVAILYLWQHSSPKGVVLSHLFLVAGAKVLPRT